MVPCGPIQWLFRGTVLISSSSGMPTSRFAGTVTLYTIWPVGMGLLD